MSVIPSINLANAIVTHWDDSQLEWEFKKNWAEADRDIRVALNEMRATDQPFPYCLYDIDNAVVDSRSTGCGAVENSKQCMHDMVLSFKIYARQLASVGKSAKDIAEELAIKVVTHFGGTSLGNYPNLNLDIGGVVLAQYTSQQGFDLGDEEYLISIMYRYLIDMPVIE